MMIDEGSTTTDVPVIVATMGQPHIELCTITGDRKQLPPRVISAPGTNPGAKLLEASVMDRWICANAGLEIVTLCHDMCRKSDLTALSNRLFYDNRLLHRANCSCSCREWSDECLAPSSRAPNLLGGHIQKALREFLLLLQSRLSARMRLRLQFMDESARCKSMCPYCEGACE